MTAPKSCPRCDAPVRRDHDRGVWRVYRCTAGTWATSEKKGGLMPISTAGWRDWPTEIKTEHGTLVLYGFKPKWKRTIHDDQRFAPPAGAKPVYVLQPKKGGVR